MPDNVSMASWRELWARIRPPRSDLILAGVLSVLVLQPFLLLTAPLAWRRRYPMAVLGIQILGILVADGELLPEQSGFLAITVGVYSVAAYHKSPVVSALVLSAFGAAVTVLFGDVVPPVPESLAAFALLVPLWLAGNSSRLARRRLDASDTRAARAERERDVAIAEERARIARELHDVVTHNVSVMVVQASAARQVLESELPPQPTPELAFSRDAMAAVERVGQQAMEELRHMLGLLGGAGGADGAVHAPKAPQAGLNQLDNLLQRVRYAGVPVSLDVTGASGVLPAGIDLTAYRVVQEALTNVLRHAPGAATKVCIQIGSSDLLVEVTNEPSSSTVDAPTSGGGGRGLAGLAERVRLFHGELSAGPSLAGGYRVEARIPLQSNILGVR